ncbi:MAG: hypothetical protein VST72_04435 [Nitrospirota bacterium]|nr:hypothetical protein [Nitrospirota bacterium]
MTEAWYDGLPDDAFSATTEIDKEYRNAEAVIRERLAHGLDYDRACEAIQVKDEALRKNIIEDMLKVLISEEHFNRKLSLEEMAGKLKISVERLKSAKLDMIEDVKDASIKEFYKSPGYPRK